MIKNKETIHDVCCAIVTFNGTSDVIHTILYYETIFDHVVVVDNNSTNGFYELLINSCHKAKIIRNSVNEGIAFALNEGVIYANDMGVDYFLSMDQDSYICFEDILALKKSIDIKNRVVSVGPSYQCHKPKQNEFVDYLITSGNLTYLKAINEINGYNSNLFIDCVDIDFSWSLLDAGYKLLLVANACMKHKIGEYEKSRIFKIKYCSHAPLRFYYIYRNTFYLYRKYKNKKFFRKKAFKLRLSLFFVDTLKLLFIERNKKLKIEYAKKGIKDAKNCKYGRIEE